MKIIIAIIFGIFLISLASAETIIAGENITISLEFEIVNCSIINNTYDLEGLNLSWNGKDIIISTVQNYKPDNFTVNCWVIKYKDVEEHIPSRGGSCITTWECTEWSDCINGNQTRNCSKVKSYCYAPKKDKPIEFKECEVQEDSEDIIPKEEDFPEEKKRLLIYILCGVVILAIIFMWYWAIKKTKKQKIKNHNDKK